MVNITSDLAWALGMVPDCLVPAGDAPHFRDEFGAGWLWFAERYEGPRRHSIADAKKHELIRLVRVHPKRTDNA